MATPAILQDPRIAAALAQLQQQAQPSPAPSQLPSMQAPAPPPAVATNIPTTHAPVTPPPSTPQGQPGPIKSFLQNFLYGGGQALLQHVGLPTDEERNQTHQRAALAQQQANDMTAYRQAQIGGLQEKANQLSASQELIPTEGLPFKGLPAMLPRAVVNSLSQSIPGYQGKVETNAVTNATKQSISDDKNQTSSDIAGQKDKTAQIALQVRRDIANGNLAMAGARLRLAQAKANGEMNGTTPTAQRLNKADLANNAQHNLGNAMDMIDQDPNLFGKVAGHFTSIEQMMGTNDPSITSLANELHAAAQASGGVHGLRSADAVKDTEKMWLNGFRNSPEATKAGLQAQSDSLNDYVNFANYGKKNAPRIPNSSQPSGAPSPQQGGNHPFFSQFGGTVVKP